MPSLSLLLLAALACHAAAPPAAETPEASVSSSPLDPDAAKALALRYGEASLGLPAGTTAALLLGTATGYPAFAVYNSATPRRPGTDVVVYGSEVLAGEPGFRRFVQAAGATDATRLGAAYALLVRNSPEEPTGATLANGALTVVVPDARGNRSQITVRIGADGSATVVSEVPQ